MPLFHTNALTAVEEKTHLWINIVAAVVVRVDAAVGIVGTVPLAGQLVRNVDEVIGSDNTIKLHAASATILT